MAKSKNSTKTEDQSIFNHKFGMLYDSLNIEEERAKEIFQFIKESFQVESLDNTSKKLEFVLSKGLNIPEVLYAGFLFGKTSEINKAIKDINSPSNLFNSFLGMAIEPFDKEELYNKLFSKYNINLPH